MPKPAMIGTINGCMTAVFFRDGRKVAVSHDTPNAMAHAFRWSGAEWAVVVGEGNKAERVWSAAYINRNGHPMTETQAGYQRA
jgi:hypothetical protein